MLGHRHRKIFRVLNVIQERAVGHLFGLNPNSVSRISVNFNDNECMAALFQMEANLFLSILDRHLLEMKDFAKCQEAPHCH